jgi:hypothetical protein
LAPDWESVVVVVDSTDDAGVKVLSEVVSCAAKMSSNRDSEDDGTELGSAAAGALGRDIDSNSASHVSNCKRKAYS